jgi:hypothetical protein
MAIKKFNAIAGFSVGSDTVLEVIDSSANVSASNLTVSGLSNLGSISNVKITGGTAGYTIVTDGSGNLSWSPSSGGGAGFVGITKDDFVANGSQSSFPLSTTPTSLEAVQVNINGLIQLESSYTLSGSNVVFSTPPLNGQKIEVTSYGVVSIDATDGQVPYVFEGAFAGNSNFTFDASNSVLSVTNLTSSGNVSAGNLKTNNLLYSNGSPYVFTTNAAGSNTQIQFNDGNAFGASNAFTFNNSTNVVSLTGNLIVENANLGNLAVANFISGNGSLLTAITGANVTGQVSNALVSGTVYTNEQPNITSVGTLTSLAVSGNLSSNVVVANTVAVNVGFTSNRANVSVTTNTVIDQFVPTDYRTAKYVISASGDNGYQSVETLLVHDGVNSYITIYGSISSNVSTDIIDITSNIAGGSGNVTLYATATGANTIVNIVSSYIKT